MNFKVKDSSILIFLMIAIFYIVGNFIWWKLNTPIIPQGIYCNYFKHIFEDWFYFVEVPKLIIWITKCLFTVFGTKNFDLQIIFSNYMFFLMSLYFIYQIGFELKNKETGNIAMIVFSLIPAVYGMSRQYGHHDYQTMCAIIPNIYFLIKSNNFTDRKYSIFYAISVGFGLLIKDSFLAYFFVSWLYVVIRSLLNSIEIKKISNIIITILIGSIIVGFHYFNINNIVKILQDPFVEQFNLPIFCISNIKILTTGISEYLLSPPIFLLFLIGLIYFIREYKNSNKWIILFEIIIPWTIVLLMKHHKLADYYVGIVPCIVLIIAVYISSIKRIIVKKGLLILLIFICLLQYIDFSYGINTNLFNYNFELNIHDKIHKFYYFNRYDNNGVYIPNIMAYKKNNVSISISEYIKNNFENKVSTIFMYKYDIKSQSLAELVKLQNNKIYIFQDFCDVINADIILFRDKISILDENIIFEIEEEVLRDCLINFDRQNYMEEICERIKKIKENYILLDVFQLSLEKDDRLFVLGKKEIFKNDTAINYKYKI